MFSTRFTHFSSAVLILGLVAGLCGCDQFISLLSTDTEEDIIQTPIEFDVGLSLPLSGTTTASTGLSMRRGFNLARDEINALDGPVRINFIVEDDGGTAEGAVAAVERLVNAGVTAVLGITYSNQARQAFPIAEANGVIAISPVSAAAGLSGFGEYAFRTALAVDVKNTAGVKATHAQLGYERAAVIYNDAEFYSISSKRIHDRAAGGLGDRCGDNADLPDRRHGFHRAVDRDSAVEPRRALYPHVGAGSGGHHGAGASNGNCVALHS